MYASEPLPLSSIFKKPTYLFLIAETREYSAIINRRKTVGNP
jgi:hypothetical protein